MTRTHAKEHARPKKTVSGKKTALVAPRRRGRPPKKYSEEMSKWVHALYDDFLEMPNVQKGRDKLNFFNNAHIRMKERFPEETEGWKTDNFKLVSSYFLRWCAKTLKRRKAINKTLQRRYRKDEKAGKIMIGLGNGEKIYVQEALKAPGVEPKLLNKALFAINKVAGVGVDRRATAKRLYVGLYEKEIREKADATADELGIMGARRVTVHNAIRAQEFDKLEKEVKLLYEKEAAALNKTRDDKKKSPVTDEEIYE